MKVTQLIETLFKKYLPSPFTIAVVLTLLTIALAFVFTEGGDNHFIELISYWESGIWNSGLLVFAYQMMLILVLGHVLVLSGPMEKLIRHITKYVQNTESAAVLVVLPTLLIAFFNWGLALIFGAILARKVGEHAQENNIPINYPLIGACGYAGLMVWHGGISGSAPIKVSELGHIKELMGTITSTETVQKLPDFISTSTTIFGLSNIVIFLVIVLGISLLAYYLGKKTNTTSIKLDKYQFKSDVKKNLIGAEKLDNSNITASVFGVLVLVAFIVQYLPALRTLNITPNMLNLFMLGLAILLHKNKDL